jgi:uncharacterized protein
MGRTLPGRSARAGGGLTGVFANIDFHYSLAGAFVSFLVGLTGVGGGSLMSPILIVLGVNPAVAVGTDLWFAAVTKTIGGVTHHKLQSVDWPVVRRLALGSIPAAVLTLAWLWLFEDGAIDDTVLKILLGCALLLTSVMMIFKPRIQPAMVALRNKFIGNATMRTRQRVIIMAGGAIVGVMVTLTSIGAGALVAVLLATAYPLRMGTKKIVGTDIVHAVPLTIVAGTGHAAFGNFDGWLLASLLIGSIPGIVAGSLVSGRVPEDWVRYSLAAMLVVSSLKMLGAF